MRAEFPGIKCDKDGCRAYEKSLSFNMAMEEVIKLVLSWQEI